MNNEFENNPNPQNDIPQPTFTPAPDFEESAARAEEVAAQAEQVIADAEAGAALKPPIKRRKPLPETDSKRLPRTPSLMIPYPSTARRSIPIRTPTPTAAMTTALTEPRSSPTVHPNTSSPTERPITSSTMYRLPVMPRRAGLRQAFSASSSAAWAFTTSTWALTPRPLYSSL